MAKLINTILCVVVLFLFDWWLFDFGTAIEWYYEGTIELSGEDAIAFSNHEGVEIISLDVKETTFDYDFTDVEEYGYRYDIEANEKAAHSEDIILFGFVVAVCVHMYAIFSNLSSWGIIEGKPDQN